MRLPFLTALACGCALLAAHPGPAQQPDPKSPPTDKGAKPEDKKPEPAGVPVLVKIDPPTAVRGSRVAVTVQWAGPSGKEPLYLWLLPQDPIPVGPKSGRTPTDPFGPFPVTPASDGGAGCVLPATLPVGPYLARVSPFDRLDQLRKTEPGQTPAEDKKDYTARVTVGRSTTAKPVLRAVHPATGYPNQPSFVLLGENFSEVPEDHVLVIDGRDELRLTPGEPPVDKGPRPEGAYVKYHSPHKLEVFGQALDKLAGRVKLRVRVGEDLSDPVPVTFSRFSETAPLIGAAIGTLVLGLFIAWVVGSRVERAELDGERYGWLTTLLMDSETGTYSLSKFQLYAWTAAASFGYVYLMVARNLIQGRFEFPPVPENLPGLLVVSVSTTALATGITSVRGPKGAGAPRASVADFITTGGVVSAERFQFFAWTVLGVLAFLFLVVTADPANLDTLPKVPEGFLYLMGASSAGYLGGKLARRPGPVVDTVVADEGSLVLEVRGRRLSRNATFEIDGEEVTCRRPGEAQLQPGAAGVSVAVPPAAPTDATLEVLQDDQEAQDKEYASALRLTIADPRDWARRHPKVPVSRVTAPPAGAAAPAPVPVSERPLFTIINPDGQKAVAAFEVRRRRPIP